MSRPFNPARIKVRSTYPGVAHVNGTLRQFEATGKDWRSKLDGMRLIVHDDDPNCVLAFAGRNMVYELYLGPEPGKGTASN